MHSGSETAERPADALSNRDLLTQQVEGRASAVSQLGSVDTACGTLDFPLCTTCTLLTHDLHMRCGGCRTRTVQRRTRCSTAAAMWSAAPTCPATQQRRTTARSTRAQPSTAMARKVSNLAGLCSERITVQPHSFGTMVLHGPATPQAAKPEAWLAC